MDVIGTEENIPARASKNRFIQWNYFFGVEKKFQIFFYRPLQDASFGTPYDPLALTIW